MPVAIHGSKGRPRPWIEPKLAGSVCEAMAPFLPNLAHSLR